MADLVVDKGGTPYLTLGVDREVFALSVGVVLEILAAQDIHHVPNAPPFLLGLIDVRGKAVPVLDLRVKLGLPPVAATEHSRIVVLDLQIEGSPLVLGLLTDRVFEVAPLDDGSMAPPPEIGMRWRSEYIRGIGRRGEAFVIILDVAHLLSDNEVALIGEREAA